MFDVLTWTRCGLRTVSGGIGFDWGGLLLKEVTEEHEGLANLVGLRRLVQWHKPPA